MFDAYGNMVLDRFTVNSESNGRFHTDWLNMMYPRLKVARDLLTEDGVIFISIDECEFRERYQKKIHFGPIAGGCQRDSSLSSDNVTDNFEQIFKAYSKDTIRKIL